MTMNRLAKRLERIAEELANESSNKRIVDIVNELGYDEMIFSNIEDWLIENGVYGSIENSFEPYSYVHMYFDDFMYEKEPVITLEYLSDGNNPMSDTEGKTTAFENLKHIEQILGMKRNGWLNPGNGKEIVKANQVTYGTKPGDMLNIVQIPLKIVDMEKFKNFIEQVA